MGVPPAPGGEHKSNAFPVRDVNGRLCNPARADAKGKARGEAADRPRTTGALRNGQGVVD